MLFMAGMMGHLRFEPRSSFCLLEPIIHLCLRVKEVGLGNKVKI